MSLSQCQNHTEPSSVEEKNSRAETRQPERQLVGSKVRKTIKLRVMSSHSRTDKKNQKEKLTARQKKRGTRSPSQCCSEKFVTDAHLDVSSINRAEEVGRCTCSYCLH